MRKIGPGKILRSYGWVFFLLLLALGGAGEAFAQEAYFNDIIVTNNADELLLYAQLEGAFTKDTDEALFNGMPLFITYSIRLLQERGAMLMDEEISSIKINYQLNYDLTTGICQFTWEEPLKKGNRATRNLPTAMKWMKELSGIKVGDFRSLAAGQRYYILLKADIRQGAVAFPLNYFNWLFRSGTSFSTPWQRASFLK